MSELVVRELRSIGFDVDTIQPEPNRISVSGQRTYSHEKPRMILYSHLDTVPPGDLSRWKYPPFGGVLDNGKIYGRGTQDCKMGV